MHLFKDRHGKLRCKHSKTGDYIDLEKFPYGTAPFWREWSRIKSKSEPIILKNGTLGGLIYMFNKGARWAELSKRTKSDYEYYFKYLKPLYNDSLDAFTAPEIAAIRDEAAKRSFKLANQVLITLRILFDVAVEKGIMPKNTARDVLNVRRPKSLGRANRPWTDDERHNVWDVLPEHMKPIIAFMMLTGIDIGDSVKLPKNAYKNGIICGARSKTGVEFNQEVPGALREILDNQNHNAITLFANSRGRPWTDDGLRSSWDKIRLSLEKQGKIDKGLTIKGLRHTVAVILREMGKDERTIADVLTQRTPSMARHYSRGADLSEKINNSVRELNDEMNRRKTKSC